MIISKGTKEKFKGPRRILQVKVKGSNFVTAYPCTGRSTTRKNQFRLPGACLDGVVLEKGYGHKRNLFDRGDGGCVDPKVLNERPVNRIVFGLKTKDPQRNIRERMPVYPVYFRLKTFKIIQALLDL